jgi:hypothetical protein
MVFEISVLNEGSLSLALSIGGLRLVLIVNSMKAHSAEKKNVYIYKLVFVLLYF